MWLSPLTFLPVCIIPQRPTLSSRISCSLLFLGDFIQSSGFKYHLYPDDSQILIASSDLSLLASRPEIPTASQAFLFGYCTSHLIFTCPKSNLASSSSPLKPTASLWSLPWAIVSCFCPISSSESTRWSSSIPPYSLCPRAVNYEIMLVLGLPLPFFPCLPPFLNSG